MTRKFYTNTPSIPLASDCRLLRRMPRKPHVPVLVIPLTRESVADLAIRMASHGMTRAIYGVSDARKMWDRLMPSTRASWLRSAQIYLAEIGIHPDTAMLKKRP